MGLSNILRKRRKELGLTLAEIAAKMGVSEATVQRWESGNIKNMRQERISSLAEVLHVTPAYLMGWEEESTQGQKKEAARKDGPTREEIEQELMSLVSKMKPEQKQRVLLEAYRLLQQQNQEDDEAKNH